MGDPGGESTSILRPYIPRIQLQWLVDDPRRTFLELDGSVVFVDISGFTRLSERLARRGKEGAEQVTDTIGTCFTDLLAVAYESGGSLLKFGGDALLLLFWGEEHVARACRAAVLMRRTLRDVGKIELPGAKVTLRMSVGINSGRFHFFLVGGSHKEFLVTGPAATRTVLMEQTAVAGEILVSPETAAALPARVLGAAKGPGVLLRREPPRSLPPDEVDVEARDEDIRAGLPVALREHVGSGAFGSEHRPVTVAFVHYDGTDALIREQGPGVAAEALDELVRDVQTAVDEQGVCFLGSDVDADGGKLILTAGAPRVLGEDEERMLLALRRIVEADRRLPVRIGVNHGSVFSGDVGPPYRRTYTVMGDTVNLAARLMARAPAGEIYATASVLDRSNTRFETTELEPFTVKGKARPVRAWSVGRAVGSRGREAVSVQRFPMVGRADELEKLGSALGSAKSGRGGVVELVGEHGIGKTRLMEELLASPDRPRVLHALCEAYSSTTPYATWRDLLRQAVGLGTEDPGPLVLEHLRKLIEDRNSQLLPWLPLVAIPFDVEAPPTPEVEQLAPEFRRPKLHEVVMTFLREQLSDPMLVEIEDAHLMDEASADLLAALAGQIEESPWLVVLTRRGDGGFVAPEGPGVTRLELGPLEPDDISELARAATEAQPLAPHVMTMVTERSAGNPQFLLDLVRAASTGASQLPDSVEAAAMVQIDQLAPDDRAVVRRASVLGVSFHPRFLEEMFEDGEPLPDEVTWERLAGLFEDEGNGYRRFRRAVVRDAAYAGLPFRTRRRLHGIAGARLEHEVGEDPEEAAGILSLHFLLAEEHAKAWRYARAAGERAAQIYANVEAARFYSRAIEAARRLRIEAADLADVWEALGQALELIGEPDSASAAYTAARRLVKGEVVREAELLVRHSYVEGNTGRMVPAVRWANRALRMLDGVAGRAAGAVRARLLALLAGHRHRQGKTTAAIELSRRAVVEAQAASDKRSLARANLVLGWALADVGALDALTYSEQALDLFRELGDLASQAMVLNNLGLPAYWDGRWNEAVELWHQAAETSARAGDVVGATVSECNVAEVLSDQGRLEEAATLLRRALSVFRGTGDEHSVAYYTMQLGRVEIRSGHAEAGIRLVGEAAEGFRELRVEGDAQTAEIFRAEGLAFARSPVEAWKAADELLGRSEGSGHVAAQLQRIRGFALTQLGRHEEAEAALLRSEALAREGAATYELAVTLDALAAVARLSGGDDRPLCKERDELLGFLGVIALPEPPLEGIPGSAMDPVRSAPA